MLDIVDSVKINSITLKQFMSFDDIELTDLDKYKIIFILSTNATGKSTLTSEALYYTLFGRSLRFKKYASLLKRGYIEGKAFSKFSLIINTKKNDTYFNITRNIIDTPKFEVSIENDINNDFELLANAKGSDDLNMLIKKLFDIDETKFSILYLKSPFSGSLFESKSTLLASITKVDFFNGLRDDFIDITKDLKKTLEIKTTYLNNQHNLLESTKKQLESFNTADKDKDENVTLLDQLKKNIFDKKNDFNIALSKKKQAIANREVRQRELSDLQGMKAKISTELNMKRSEYSKYSKLIKAGKCPTCSQLIGKSLYQDQLKELAVDGEKMSIQLKNVDDKLIDISKRISVILKYIDDAYNVEQNLSNNIINLNNRMAQIENKLQSDMTKKSIDIAVISQITSIIDEISSDIAILNKDYNILNNIYNTLLTKKGNYINKFYNQKIINFTVVYKTLLIKFTKGKFYEVKIDMDNTPTFNKNILYESLSTSERKIVDIAFIIAYIVYLSSQLKFKTFILDETFDSLDPLNMAHVYDTIYKIANEYNLQIFITTNMEQYVVQTASISENTDVKLINLRELIGLDVASDENIYDEI